MEQIMELRSVDGFLLTFAVLSDHFLYIIIQLGSINVLCEYGKQEKSLM